MSILWFYGCSKAKVIELISRNRKFANYSANQSEESMSNKAVSHLSIDLNKIIKHSTRNKQIKDTQLYKNSFKLLCQSVYTFIILSNKKLYVKWCNIKFHLTIYIQFHITFNKTENNNQNLTQLNIFLPA